MLTYNVISDFITKIKDLISKKKGTNTIEVGGNLEVDGKLDVFGEVYFDSDFLVSSGAEFGSEVTIGSYETIKIKGNGEEVIPSANVEEETTETLSNVKIRGTTYSINAGGGYVHHLKIVNQLNTNLVLMFDIIDADSTPYNAIKIDAYFKARGYVIGGATGNLSLGSMSYPCGINYYKSGDNYYFIIGVGASTSFTPAEYNLAYLRINKQTNVIDTGETNYSGFNIIDTIVKL